MPTTTAAAAARAVLPLRREPAARVTSDPVVLPAAGAYRVVAEVYPADAEPPEGAAWSPLGYWVRYGLVSLDTGETHRPVRPTRPGGVRSL